MFYHDILYESFVEGVLEFIFNIEVQADKFHTLCVNEGSAQTVRPGALQINCVPQACSKRLLVPRTSTPKSVYLSICAPYTNIGVCV